MGMTTRPQANAKARARKAAARGEPERGTIESKERKQ